MLTRICNIRKSGLGVITRINSGNYRSMNMKFYSTESTESTAKATTEAEKTVDETIKLKKELATLKDLYLRNLAEMENLRHRTARELEKEKEYGIKKFAKEILIVNDFLELSLKHENAEREQLISGIKMTQKEFEKILEKFGIVKYNPLGQKFDFNLHTAIFQQEARDKEPGTVCHVDKVGTAYKCHKTRLDQLVQRNFMQNIVKDLALANEQTWLQIGTKSQLTQGQLSEQMKDTERALLAYENSLRHNPFATQTLIMAAKLYRSLERYPKAVEFFQRVLKLDEANGEIWGALGQCYLMVDDLHKAYSAYQQALYHLPNPRDPELWYGIGILYDRYGSYDHAEDAFTAVIEMEPNFEKYLMAKEEYERVLKESPNHAKVLQQLGWLYQQQSTGFTNLELAVTYLNKSLDSDQADAQTWYLLGRVYMLQQLYNDAYNAYQQAVYRDGRNPTFWCSIGVLYYQINQYPDALDAYGRAIRLNPYISEVWYDLGTLYESCENQTSDALDAYTKALELDPNNTLIKTRLEALKNLRPGQPPLQALPPQQPSPLDMNTSKFATGPTGSGPPPQPPTQQLGHAPRNGPNGGLRMPGREVHGGQEKRYKPDHGHQLHPRDRE